MKWVRDGGGWARVGDIEKGCIGTPWKGRSTWNAVACR